MASRLDFGPGVNRKGRCVAIITSRLEGHERRAVLRCALDKWRASLELHRRSHRIICHLVAIVCLAPHLRPASCSMK